MDCCSRLNGPHADWLAAAPDLSCSGPPRHLGADNKAASLGRDRSHELFMCSGAEVLDPSVSTDARVALIGKLAVRERPAHLQ